MARRDTPGDIKPIGRTSKGFVLPNGLTFRDKGKLVQYLRNNPGVVWKHRGYLKSQLGKDTLGLAGYNIDMRGGRMQQFDGVPGRSTKMIRAWTSDKKEAAGLKTRAKVEGTKIIKVKPTKGPRYGTEPKPVVKKAKPTVTATKPAPGKKTDWSKAAPTTTPGVGKNTPTPKAKTAARVPAGKQGATLFDMAIARLLGLNPGAGFKPIDPASLLAGLEGDTSAQSQMIRSAMSDLDKQGQSNVKQIGDWFGQVGQHVDRARTRGADMTRDLSTALAGNNAALLASIGGEAAPGASAVGQVAQGGQNTLAAMGAADAQFLSDIGPLLEAEGAGLKASELGRLAQVKKEYQNQLTSLKTEDNSKRAELALQIAQMNNQGRQQQFSNSASVAETLAGLALSGEKLSADKQQAIMAAMQSQANAQREQGDEAADRQFDVWKTIFGAKQDQAENAQSQAAAQARSLDQKIARANADIGKNVSVEDFPRYQRGKLAPPGLVQSVLNFYRSQGVDLRDPRARKAAMAVIKTYGVQVDPKWVRGWD